MGRRFAFARQSPQPAQAVPLAPHSKEASASSESISELNDSAMVSGKGPDARRRSEAYLAVDGTLRSDNEADGPFPAHPPGDASFARTRRRALIAGEICIVAGPLGYAIDSNWCR